MSKQVLKSRSDVCRICDFISTQQSIFVQPRRFPNAIKTLRTFTTTRENAHKPRSSHRPMSTDISRRMSTEKQVQTRQFEHVTGTEIREVLKDAEATWNSLLEYRTAPPEGAILDVLHKCQIIAVELAGEPAEPIEKKKESTAAASLLTSVDSATVKLRLSKLPPEAQRLVDELSQLLYSIVRHPSVFITPKILEVYVSAQSSLGNSQAFPDVFYMYANKPLPVEGSSPIRYKQQNPNNVNNSIPVTVTDQALQTAVEARELRTAMDIIDTTYALKAFRRAKFVRKGLVPSLGVAATPVAAYAVASQLATFQSTMEPGMATNIAFAGILAYMGFTATIGVVAVTTANDQMDRVTWAPGMPLRERWIREEERAAIDKVAGSWGFHEKWRRGEEEGKDWELLREWIGNKGMLLDAVELMEGME